MWLDILAGGLLLVFTAVGAWRGALASGLALANLVLSYAAAVFGGPQLAPVLGEALGVGDVIGLAAASTLCFAATFLVTAGIGAVLRSRALPPEGARDRFLGGLFGALRGGGLVLLIAYLAIWLEAARVHGAADFMPELGSSTAADVTSNVVESAVEASLGPDDSAGRMVARIAARPAAAIGGLTEIAESEPFAALRGDRLFWTYVESGNADAALARASYLRLQRNPELRAELAGLGLVPEAAAEDTEVFREAVKDVLLQVGPRLRAVRTDPGLQELLDDPEVVAMLQNGDTLGLMRHPGFRALVDRAISRPVSEG